MASVKRSRTTRLRELRASVLEPTTSIEPAKSPGEVRYAEALVNFLTRHDYKSALEDLETARQLFESDEENAVCLLEEAHIYMLWGRSRDACLRLEAARDLLTEEHELFAEAHYLLARLYPADNRFEEAIAAHKRAKAHYQSGELTLGDYYGYSVWLHEQSGNFEEWARAVAVLANECPDKMALHKLPRQSQRLLARGERLIRALKSRSGDPETADMRWFRALEALTLYIAGQFEQASEILDQLLEFANSLPAPHFVWHLAGKCALRQNRLAHAIDCFETIKSSDKRYFDLYLDLAMSHEMVGNYELALEYYQELESIAPDQLLPVQRIAVIYESLNDHSNAVSAYEKLTEKDPSDQSAVVRLALISAELQQDKLALTWLNKSLQLFGSDAILLLTRARVLERSQSDKEALRDLSKVVDILEPLLINKADDVLMPIPGADSGPAPAGDPQALRPRNEAAFKTANRLVADARLLQAKIYARMQRNSEAEQLIDQVLAEQPENETALLLKGDLARKSGSHEEAVNNYKALINKVLGESLLQDGLKLSLEGKYNEALGKYRQAYERFPKNWSVFYNTALAYAQLANFESVTQYLLIARRINRDVPALVEDDPKLAIYRTTESYANFKASL